MKKILIVIFVLLIATGVWSATQDWKGTVNNATIGQAWTTPSFSAGDYTANGSGTWTVEAGDVTTMKYMIQGKTMFINFKLSATTVGGTPSTQLFIAIPNSQVATSATVFFLNINNGSGWKLAAGTITASGSTLNLFVDQTHGGANWAIGTNNTYLYGSVVFEIN